MTKSQICEDELPAMNKISFLVFDNFVAEWNGML